MKRLVTDFPESRTVPPWTLRALREIDPNAEVLYLGPSPKGGRWLLGTVDQTDNRLRARAAKALRVLGRVHPRKRDIAWARRYWLERAKYQGFRSRYVYECAEPAGYIVENVRHAFYDNQRTREQDVLASYVQEEDRRREAAERDLADKHRAHEAHRYAFTRSHRVTDSYSKAGLISAPTSSVRSRVPLTPA